MYCTLYNSVFYFTNFHFIRLLLSKLDLQPYLAENIPYIYSITYFKAFLHILRHLICNDFQYISNALKTVKFSDEWLDTAMPKTDIHNGEMLFEL